ncbi:hypothetical protein BGW36DRAFT_356124 [Talaromyces proteolyticus]|uniref:Uncharacterized protein n=1 Tax=Talaromyces proteolyticus TaxID=1131652 RepID=A0AAD4Q3N9_9EURO|nr:uncharacterized protein BGW36DRAFT_356124 [Talaromyces proteolyticus]KAH8701978.1 hypothetical protein BGW36DRAFT_356124 [Talaromyces proteolyticus]
MSTLALSPLGVQPLAPLAQPGLRALRQTKMSKINRMNAIPRSTPLKCSIVYNSDEENMAPTSKLDSTKRKRTAEDDEQLYESPKALKTDHVPSAVTLDSKRIEASTPRKIKVAIGKPAGRSPVTKPLKAFGRRSQRDSTIKRPSFVPSYRPSTSKLQPKRQPTQPAGWAFDIHVDTPEEEATNTMQHFAGRLDISDDEVAAKVDDRGKENIPPHELGIVMPSTPQPSVSTSHERKNMMALSRSPLGELKASDYFPKDLKDVFHTAILDEEPVKSISKIPSSTTVSNSLEFTEPEITSSDFANTKAEIALAVGLCSVTETPL